jgi:hypothetical protein
MPTFENGWICRKCWCANRETDDRCYRCHAVPERRVMPEPITFSMPDGKPNEERKKVSSLTAAAVARPAEPTMPAAPAVPRPNAILAGLGVIITTIIRFVSQVVRLVRAAPGAPHAARQAATTRMHAGMDRVTSPWRAMLAHRRTWLSVAWMISALTSALLFSVALRAPFAASLLVVASVAIFSGLTTAITMNASDRHARPAAEAPHRQPDADPVRAHMSATPDHASQPAKVLRSRPAR